MTSVITLASVAPYYSTIRIVPTDRVGALISLLYTLFFVILWILQGLIVDSQFDLPDQGRDVTLGSVFWEWFLYLAVVWLPFFLFSHCHFPT